MTSAALGAAGEVDAVDELRMTTRVAHEALERADLILPATRDRERYALLVGGMLSFHLAVERELRRHDETLRRRGVTTAGCYRAEPLRAESRRLGSPSCPEPAFGLTSAAHAVGALYVLEGSTLGGTVIGASLQRHLGLSSSYYGVHGSRTKARWTNTCRQINRFAPSDAERAAMRDGAIATFGALHAHLEAILHRSWE